MTERFEVPEPSAKAVEEGRGPVQREVTSHWPLGRGAPWYLHDHIVSASLAAAYAVDVPRIVRAEVERALYARQENPLGFGIAAYLGARFPDATPPLRRPPGTVPSAGKVMAERMGREILRAEQSPPAEDGDFAFCLFFRDGSKLLVAPKVGPWDFFVWKGPMLPVDL